MIIKDAEIKIRLTKEQKELFKKVAKSQGISMSEFIVVTTEKMARKKAENIRTKEIIEDRAIRTDKKLFKIKEKMIEKEIKKNTILNSIKKYIRK